MINLKKGEETLVSTAFSSTRSMITFFVAILVLLSLFIIVYNYSNLVEERTIEVKSDTDFSLAKEQLQTQVTKLELEIGELRALVS